MDKTFQFKDYTNVINVDNVESVYYQPAWRDQKTVRPWLRNFFRRLVGKKPIRSYRVPDKDIYCGFYKSRVVVRFAGGNIREYIYNSSDETKSEYMRLLKVMMK